MAAAILTTGTVIVALTVALKINTDGSLVPEDGFQSLMQYSFVVLGAITVWRRPENRTSWLLAWVGVALGLSILSDEYSTPDAGTARALEQLQTVAAWFSSWLWVVSFGPLATLLLLWFPTGRPPSPRWKWVERLAIGIIVGIPILLAFAQDPENDGVNPLAIDWVTSMLQGVFVVLSPAFPMLVGVCAISLLVRFRRSRGDERQQLKWFVVAAFMVVVYMAVDTALSATGTRPAWVSGLEAIAFLSIPFAAGLAILKYRLYDIDLVINRALVYGSLTAILAGAYVGLVFALQAVLAPVTAQSDVAVAASTLAVAALFRPVRARVQAFIDRRFYRRKFDVQETVEGFGEHLRDEIDVASLGLRLQEVVRDTMQPAHVSLWLKRAER